MPFPPDPKRHPLHATLLLLAPLLLGLAWYFRPGENLGDVCDQRFNTFIMEHGFQWLMGRVPEFWDAGIFYPATHNTVAYSDAHIGNLPLYTPFRLLGLPREHAMAAWAALVCALNYAAAAWVLRQLTRSDLGAAMGAYLFTFGLPFVAQFQHVQLFPRYFVALAFWFLIQAIETRAHRPFALLALMVVGQLYTGLYIGIFLVQVLVYFLVAHALVPSTRRALLDWLLPRAVQPWLVRVAVVLLAGLALVPMMVPYLSSFHALGGRTWPIVVSLVFSPVSLLLPAQNALLWNGLTGLGRFVSSDGEHRAFVGGTVFALAAAYAWLRRQKRGLPDERLLWVTLAAVLLTTLMTARLSKSLSLYYFMYILPGFGSLRAIARIILVLLFPIALLLAFWTSALETWVQTQPRRWLKRAFAPLLLTVLLLDQAVVPFKHFTIADHAGRIAAYEVELRARPRTFKAFAIVGPEFIVDATDSLLVAQDTGIPTASGYSGNFPKDWAFPETDAKLAAWLDACNRSGKFGAPLTLADVAILRERR